MFKSPRRNGRNKRFKIKHVIQISMLFGVSIWLLYQIHHSDDKKPSVTTKISQKLNNDSSKDVFKLGRKVLRPKVKETKADDEQNNEKEGLEDVEDRESEEHEEVGENEHVDSKEDSDEIKEHENEKENDYKGNEQSGKIQMKQSDDGNKSNQQNQVVVMENTVKKMSPSEEEDDDDDDDGDDERSIRGEVENDKMMNNGENKSGEDDTGSNKQPSVDHNEHNSKDQTAQQIDSAPDSYSYEANTASYMKSTGNDKNMKADTDSEAQSKNGKSIQNGESEKKDDVPMLEGEKDVLTDLEMLQESGTGGSITLENSATE